MGMIRRDKTEVEEDDSYYSQHFVSQHDILRDLAIRQSNCGIESGDRLVIDVTKKSFPKWWKPNMYHQPVHARLVSISTGNCSIIFIGKYMHMYMYNELSLSFFLMLTEIAYYFQRENSQKNGTK